MSAVPVSVKPSAEEVTNFLIASISELVGSPVSRFDNIFDLGVESLMLVDLKDQVQESFGVSVKFSDFFTHFEIDALATLITERAEELR